MALTFTDYEKKLVTDPAILLTKNRIIQKVSGMFETLSEEYQRMVKASGLVLLNEANAKISKGENYRGLPYLVLDYPRQFDKTDVFAIRSFFWWGNFYSITLQLSGCHQDKYAARIEENINAGLLKGWFLGCSSSPWDHHFEKDNYQLIDLHQCQILTQLPFIKLAKKIPLDEWENTFDFFKKNFETLINITVP